MDNYVSLINGKFLKTVSVLDRGLSYGDGLFETMSWRHLRELDSFGVEFWNRHLKRLSASSLKMKIKMPSKEILNNYKNKIIKKSINSGFNEGVLKVIITRGVGGRGYKYEQDIEPTIIFLSFPKVRIDESFFKKGVNLRFCKSPIFVNHQLSGIKHLNRIDSVLARSEWRNKKFFDGVLLDDSKNMIDGTMTNIFFSKNNILYTPDLKKSGINGIMRQVVIEKAKIFFDSVREIHINKKNLKLYDEMFITNSIIKILPVKKLENKEFSISQSTRNLINHFSEDKKTINNLEFF